MVPASQFHQIEEALWWGLQPQNCQKGPSELCPHGHFDYENPTKRSEPSAGLGGCRDLLSIFHPGTAWGVEGVRDLALSPFISRRGPPRQ